MRILVVGATGAVGRRLVPLLIERGHQVSATTTSAGRAARLRDTGLDFHRLDLLDREAVLRTVRAARPDVIVHQATALKHLGSDLRNFEEDFALTNRLRTDGTAHLLAAARQVGAWRLVAQSFGGWIYERAGAQIKTEDDALDPHPPAAFASTLTAIKKLEALVVHAEEITGVALRYGCFYGPGTSLGEGGTHLEALRKRRFPVIGSGAGVWSFAHIDDVAAATAAACEGGRPGIYNVCDDEPAPVAEWLPVLAEAVGAKPPRHVPAWLARMIAGEGAVSMMTRIRGASNAKAKREFDWQPRWSTWRSGFVDGLAAGRPPSTVASLDSVRRTRELEHPDAA